MNYFSRIKSLDWTLMGFIVLLGASGLVTLASINSVLFRAQIIWYALFFVAVFVGVLIDWRWLLGSFWFRQGVYWISVSLLVFTNIQSGFIRGTKSWITFGDFQFEPVELAKFALIIILADFFSVRGRESWLAKNILISLVYMAIPFVLVILQPDFGSGIVLFFIWIGFLVMNGIDFRRMSVIAGVCILLVVVSWFFVLQPYQKGRITAYIFPEMDPYGASYNVIQSKVAIGSAGWFGKGYGLGTQTHLRFLPEPETDFIFASFVEEWGVVGGVAMLLLFLAVLFRITKIGMSVRNVRYQLVSIGFVIMLVIHMTINIGSTLGITPVTGLSLPFVSYGGSNLLTLSILVAIMQRITLESNQI
jgi:rod shape determining protein RodA